MLRARIPNTKLDEILRRRAAAARSHVEPQVVAALSGMRAAGACVEVIGSFARGGFQEGSDVDFLVLDPGPLTERELDRLVSRHVLAVPYDLVFADHLDPGTAELMLAHARPPAT